MNKDKLLRAYLRAMYDDLGFSHRPLRESDMDAHIPTVELALADPTATAKDFHEAWVARRLAAGWTQSWHSDFESKRHKQLLHFEKLPPQDQKTERLGEAALRAAIASERA